MSLVVLRLWSTSRLLKKLILPIFTSILFAFMELQLFRGLALPFLKFFFFKYIFSLHVYY